jgi:hypothetical protein
VVLDTLLAVAVVCLPVAVLAVAAIPRGMQTHRAVAARQIQAAALAVLLVMVTVLRDVELAVQAAPALFFYGMPIHFQQLLQQQVHQLLFLQVETVFTNLQALAQSHSEV